MEDCAWLETLLNKKLNDNSIKRVLDINFENAVASGDNYASQIQKATINVIYGNGFKCKKTLIYKLKHVDDGSAMAMDEFQVFKRECKIYKQVLLKFDELMDEYQDNNDRLWCNIIGHNPSYTLIVLEDLKALNYKLADRKKLLDLNHTLLVMHSLGRFHALGHVLLKNGLLHKDDFDVGFLQFNSPIFKHLRAGGLYQFANVMRKDWSPEWTETAARLNKEEEVILKKLKDVFEIKDDAFVTVCHGDCWTSNIMFRYCPYDDDLPVALKLLDYQFSYLNSGIFDICLCLFTSVKFDIRRKELDKFLSIYHKSLKSTLAFYGMEQNAPNIEYIYEEFKRIEYFSFVSSVVDLPVTCSKTDNAFMTDYLLLDYHEKNAYNPEIFNNELFSEGIKEDLKYWMDIGIF